MERRDFVRGAAAGSVLAMSGVPLASAHTSVPSVARQDTAPVPPFALEEATVAALQAAMASGQHTARSIAEAYLQRIEALDRTGPALRAVLEVNPDALEIADAVDAERQAKGPRGPLHRIPVLLKDHLGSADRMSTTAGSPALMGVTPTADSFVVRRLREAGVVLLGKTNLSEWANFRSTHSISGWSSRGGLSRNPYALDRSPCGSSSGSAVAVSANLAALAVGTETDGSILCPASVNGLVGIKPTVGLVSRTGIIPIAHSQDTAGPMARTVRDAAVLLGAMAGVDPADPAAREAEGRPFLDYTAFPDAGGLRGARLGVAGQYLGFHGEVDRLMEDALEAMRQAGALIVGPVHVPYGPELATPELNVLLYEFKADLNAYLAGLGPAAPVKSLRELIAFNEANRAEVMRYFGQELFEMAEEKGPLTEPEYRHALALCQRLSRTEGIDAVLARYSLHAIVAPTAVPAWTVDLVHGDRPSGGSSSPAAVAGYPAVSVPMGFVRGLPVGITFVGAAWTEPILLTLAYAFEQETKARRPPSFRLSAEV